MSVFDDLKKNVTDFTENVAKKSSVAIETQKLKMKKSSLESDMRDCYIALGRLYEKRLTAQGEKGTEESRIVEQLAQLRASVSQIQEDLRKQKGVVTCPSCGRDVSKAYEFCPKCGAPLKEKASSREEKGEEKSRETQDEEKQTGSGGPDESHNIGQ
ncbi:MAG TPA: zinc-ribbon domain-containing protein [Candidatus Scybalocola faecavium]|nr:zinc-ribbon domain-containing protein [Candidatus Scybalocola faecavium]